MATTLENLIAARDNFAAQLVELSANPKPSYNIDGQSVRWTEHYKFISSQIDKLNDQINDEQPFEIVSRGGG